MTGPDLVYQFQSENFDECGSWYGQRRIQMIKSGEYSLW